MEHPYAVSHLARLGTGWSLLAAAVCIYPTPRPVRAQTTPTRAAGRDSIVVSASTAYTAGSLRRQLLGDGFRDLWAMPIKVPVLDLRAYADGLKALKTGGGNQTKTLRLVSARGLEYVFRPVYKGHLANLGELEGTLAGKLTLDAQSAAPPAAPLLAGPFLDAVGVLHPVPRLVVMPDDSALGDFRAEFAGLLGTIEEFPSVPDDAPGFASASKIIDSEDLLARINRDPDERVDAHAFLKARLIDLLIGDNDRHPGQWKWARLSSAAHAPWVPIPRDRDNVFISHTGKLKTVARLASSNLVHFDQMAPTAQFVNAIEFDRRLLVGLDRPAWDSTAHAVVQAISDSVIDAALRAMPREYYPALRTLIPAVQSRRSQLAQVAGRYYRALFDVADVHATDAGDRATIVRSADGVVDIRLQSGNDSAYFERRFLATDTREIRLYLHDGDDTAVVRGRVPSSIELYVVGGNGTNLLLDSSEVGGRRRPAHLYDRGSVSGVTYLPDTMRSNTVWNRRPLMPAYGPIVALPRDRGTEITPVFGVKTDYGLGFTPTLGIRRYAFGFAALPYASMVAVDVSYSTTLKGFAAELETDNRFARSAMHIISESQWSQIDVGDFHGFGNDAPDPAGMSRIRQQTWHVHPALGFALGESGDISLGPTVTYSTTDSVADGFIARQRPYGFQRFGETGLQLDFRYDTRDAARGRSAGDAGENANDASEGGFAARVAASAYPAVWDVERAFGRISVVAATYLVLPAPKQPVVALRIGGERLFGDFPYFEAAFIGGSASLRTVSRQRFAGDASVYGSAELRVPVRRFAFLVPLDLGLLGLMDAGRVFLDGESPGGWHTGVGGGLSLGAFGPGTNVNMIVTNNREQRVRIALGFDY